MSSPHGLNHMRVLREGFPECINPPKIGTTASEQALERRQLMEAKPQSANEPAALGAVMAAGYGILYSRPEVRTLITVGPAQPAEHALLHVGNNLDLWEHRLEQGVEQDRRSPPLLEAARNEAKLVRLRPVPLHS
jgi:hypothetical protein